MLLLLTPSLYLEQSPNVSFLIENEYFFRSLPKNYGHHVYYGNFSGLSTDHFVFMKTYGITYGRAFMKGYFSGECYHRVCVDGIKKNLFSQKKRQLWTGPTCLLRSFSNGYGDGNENGKKAIGID